nr:prepilin-type N-terminal cleavage/methylation domain-containing protein [uncultured Rhodopila sp.]
MKRRSAGFTLIEVLTVLCLAGLILAILAQGMRLGMQGAGTYRRAVQTQSGIEPVEHVLRRMIERMDPGTYPESPLVRGNARELAFTTDLPGRGGGSMTADVRLEADDGHLVLWWTPHAGGVPFGAPPAAQREILLDRVARLEIAYTARQSPETWVSSWALPALPNLVRLRIVLSSGGESWPSIVARPMREQAEE